MLSSKEKQFLSALHDQSGIPVVVYQDGKCIFSKLSEAIRTALDNMNELAMMLECKKPTLFVLGDVIQIIALPVSGKNDPYTLLMGPCYAFHFNDRETTDKVMGIFKFEEGMQSARFEIPLVSSMKLCYTLQLAGLYLKRQDISVTRILDEAESVAIKTIERGTARSLFENREAEEKRNHLPYSREMYIIQAIKAGETQKIVDIRSGVSEFEIREMDNHSQKYYLYMYVGTVTLATRAAIEGGLSEMEAYTLSDSYLHHAEECRSKRELFNMIWNVCIEFASRVSEVNSDSQYS